MKYAEGPTAEATVHVAASPERVWELVCEDPANPTALWRFELSPRGRGTDLRQWARMGPGPSHLNRALAAMPDKEERIVAGRLREWQAGIDANLAAITKLAES